MKLILGSGSPRRKEILEEAGFAFSVVTADVVESDDAGLGLEGLAVYNARLKAEAVYDLLPKEEEQVVIGSDTVVWLDEKAYGKPDSVEESYRMLSELSGKTHLVGTGIALVSGSGTESYCEVAKVTFHDLSAEDIRTYVNEVHVSDKAGSYAIQDGGERIVKKYEGEFKCIMGLPIIKLQEKLIKLGFIKI